MPVLIVCILYMIFSCIVAATGRRDTQRERQISRAFYPRRLSSTLPCPALVALPPMLSRIPFTLFFHFYVLQGRGGKIGSDKHDSDCEIRKYGVPTGRILGRRIWNVCTFLASLCSPPSGKLNAHVLMKTLGICGHTRKRYLGAHLTHEHKGSGPSVLPLDSCILWDSGKTGTVRDARKGKRLPDPSELHDNPDIRILDCLRADSRLE
jgi:hypothetical protein